MNVSEKARASVSRWWHSSQYGPTIFIIILLAAFTGIVAVAYHQLIHWISRFTIERFSETPPHVFVIGSFVCVTGASLLASLITRIGDPRHNRSGVLATKLAFWKDFGFIPLRTAVTKFLASAVTLGGGVSLGPEGPSVQIGAATMSGSARILGVAKQRSRLFCAGGAAAGLAAVFNAPLAAIAFVLEEIIGDLQSRLIGAVLLAAITGALVAQSLLGSQPAFQAALLEGTTWTGILLTIPVAVLASLIGIGFQAGTIKTRGVIRKYSRIPGWLRPSCGALGTWILGCSAFFLTGRLGVFGIGYGDVTACIDGSLAWHVALILCAAKLGATLLAVGTGGVGGIFAPSFFIGAMSGGFVAKLANLFIPLSASEQSMLVMVGMCACLGAVIRTPITCILLIFEVTHQFAIVPLLLLATLISQIVSRSFLHEGIYEQMLRQDGEDPLRTLPPRDYRRWSAMPVSAVATYHPVCAENTDLQAIRKLLDEHPYHCFPVLNPQKQVSGILTRREAIDALEENREVRLHPANWISRDESMGSAQKLIIDSPSNILCVCDNPSEHPVLVGVLTLHDILRSEVSLLDSE